MPLRKRGIHIDLQKFKYLSLKAEPFRVKLNKFSYQFKSFTPLIKSIFSLHNVISLRALVESVLFKLSKCLKQLFVSDGEQIKSVELLQAE